MWSRFRGLVIAVFLTSIVASCIPIPYPPSGELNKTEDDIEDLVANTVSRNNVIARLGNPSRQYGSVISYLACRRAAGVALLLVVSGGVSALEFSGEKKCYELVLEFDVHDRLIGYKKLLFEGDFITPDGIKLATIRLMAEKGIPESQWRLYNEGGKKPKDIFWLCHSADNGYAKAQLYVGSLYWSASDITQNKIKAYVWYKLAATGRMLQGLLPDVKTQNEAALAIHDAEISLTPEQLKEAELLYTEWTPGQCELELVLVILGN